MVGSTWQITLIACDIEDFALSFVLVNHCSSAMLSSRVFVGRRDKEVVYFDCNIAFSVGSCNSSVFCRWLLQSQKCAGFC